jgi:DNA-binding winged helix-turn-helix (wHTH) protein/class 3 adenylate cyclase
MLYVFGEFELDTQRYELRQVKRVQHLEPQGFKVLLYLIERRDRVVSKHELFEHLWPDQYVTEATLTQRLVAVRRALGDNGRTQRYIRTVHGRGYRFVEPVVEHAEVAPSPPEPAVSPEPQPTLLVSAPPGPPPRLADPSLSRSEQNRASQVAPEGERKQVTVLVAAIKDALALIRDLDPEVAQQLLEPALRAMMEAVQRYGGTVQQVQGDSIMALFGTPLAQEDHVLRAGYAALAVQAALRLYADEVQRTHGLALQWGIGLNAGEVVLRAMSHALPIDSPAMGLTPYLAIRMEQLAPPGTILLPAATAQLIVGLLRVKASACAGYG